MNDRLRLIACFIVIVSFFVAMMLAINPSEPPVASTCDSYQRLKRSMPDKIKPICEKAWAKRIADVKRWQEEDIRELERRTR